MFIKYILTYFLHLNSYLLTFLLNTISMGTTFVSFSSVLSTLKLKTHSQLTQSPFMGTDYLLCKLHFSRKLDLYCKNFLQCQFGRYFKLLEKVHLSHNVASYIHQSLCLAFDILFLTIAKKFNGRCCKRIILFLDLLLVKHCSKPFLASYLLSLSAHKYLTFHV